MKKLILAGNSWVDIDAYACIITLGELMTLKGEKVSVYLPKDTSVTVTDSLKKLEFSLDVAYDISDFDEYVLVDVSDYNYLKNVCNYDLEKVVKIYDHHFESYDYWKENLGENAIIEHIGACATLIYELAMKDGFYDKLSVTSKTLLFVAIVSHTMNLKYSEITTSRDVYCYNVLKNDLDINDNWISDYFNDISETSLENVSETLKNDTKNIDLNGKKFLITQLELWSQGEFISTNIGIIFDVLSGDIGDYVFYIGSSIVEGKTYFVTKDSETQKLLREVLGITFENDIGIYDKLLIRKEFIKRYLKFIGR